MPELAEVEFYRKQWDPGIGRTIQAVKLHPDKRVLRGVHPSRLRKALRGQVLCRSRAHGKQMLFVFSGSLWLGVHLGMTGRLHHAEPGVAQGKHDHLVLQLDRAALVFTDPRQFGRILWHEGPELPPWWQDLPPSLLSTRFKQASMEAFLQRHERLPIKAALLLQEGFPGIGNWMADEILWRSALHPRTLCRNLTAAGRQVLWKNIRFVCRRALDTIGRDFSDPPRGWFFHERWGTAGQCPRHRCALLRETVGGRTTAWCAQCQPEGRA